MPAEIRGSPFQRRREGFANQRLVVLPESVIRTASEISLLRGLIPVAAGFFPAAGRHFVERAEPLPDAIVMLCTSGQGWVRVGLRKAQPVVKDCLVFIAPGEIHAYGADDINPWSIYWAHFRGAEAAEFFKLFGADDGNPVVRLPAGAAERVNFCGICERLEEDYTLPNLLSAAMRLRTVLAELNRLRAGYDTRAGGGRIEQTIVWMREHLAERADLSALARKAGLSVAHYSAVFRQRTGYPPIDYFLRMKVQHACRLLDTTPMRISEIAAAVGFEDPFYFSRLFQRIMTKSPRAYRAAAKG